MAAAHPEPGASGSGGDHEDRLPRELTGLVGRADALDELEELQSRARLLTLSGPGGVGKSRLGLALARARGAAYPGGVWWVDLAAVADADLVPQLVGSAVGSTAPIDATGESLVRHLRGPPRLLVLDNCEHVAAAAAALAGRLLQRCDGLDVIATSRTPLGVPGEQLWRVPGLALTGDGDAAAPVSPAGELFVLRAGLAAPAFACGADEAGAVERICAALDGMPLAIELAAAKAAILTIEEIADRLDHDLRFLRSSSRTVHVRQRSLEATLEWSYRLLGPAEQTLLRRLSVFAGTFSLSAAEAVCAGGEVTAHDVLDLLAGLVDQSLVQIEPATGGNRFRLLQTVRHYAARQLADHGEQDDVAMRHAAFFCEFARHADARGGDAAALDRLEREQDNLRAALQTLLATSPAAAGNLLEALWPFWQRRGAYREGRGWLERALVVADQMPPDVRAEVLIGAGVLAFLQCDYPLAADRLDTAMAIHRERGDQRGVAGTLQRLGSIWREQGQYAEARRLHEESRAIWDALGDTLGVAISQDYLGFAAWLAGDFPAAAEHSGEALVAFERAGRAHETAAALINLGATAQYMGDDKAAGERLERALELSRSVGYREGVAWALHELAIVARKAHHPSRAADLLRESLLTHRDLGDRWRIASVLEEIAGALLARIHPRAAVRILGAADRLRQRLGAPIPPAERPDRERALAVARQRLDPGAYDAAWAQGRSLHTEAAIDAALDAVARLYGSAGRPAQREGRPVLTLRERAVLRMLADGSTNREIGAALFISPSTAGVHVSNILRKLGASSRAEAAVLGERMDLLAGAASSVSGEGPAGRRPAPRSP